MNRHTGRGGSRLHSMPGAAVFPRSPAESTRTGAGGGPSNSASARSAGLAGGHLRRGKRHPTRYEPTRSCGLRKVISLLQRGIEMYIMRTNHILSHLLFDKVLHAHYFRTFPCINEENNGCRLPLFDYFLLAFCKLLKSLCKKMNRTHKIPDCCHLFPF